MRYTSDLTPSEWNLISYCFPKASNFGRPREYSYLEIFNGILYVNKTGCQWRNVPKDLPPWGSVYHYYRTWTRSALLPQIHAHLREQVRLEAGKKRQPTAAILDSQTIKSSETSSERGYDAGKKINGRKRHLLVDTMGLMLMVMVLPANVQDRDGARRMLNRFSGIYKALRLIWADGGYAGQLVSWVKGHLGCLLEIVKRSDDVRGFKVLPRRWVVERTFGWFGRYRRLSRDYERLASSGEVMVYLAMTRLMLRRLTI
jgi:putative transposase